MDNFFLSLLIERFACRLCMQWYVCGFRMLDDRRRVKRWSGFSLNENKKQQKNHRFRLHRTTYFVVCRWMYTSVSVCIVNACAYVSCTRKSQTVKTGYSKCVWCAYFVELSFSFCDAKILAQWNYRQKNTLRLFRVFYWSLAFDRLSGTKEDRKLCHRFILVWSANGSSVIKFVYLYCTISIGIECKSNVVWIARSKMSKTNSSHLVHLSVCFNWFSRQ